MILAAKRLISMVLNCVTKDEFKDILKLSNSEGLVWLKAKCVEAVIMNELPATVLQKPPVKVWIKRVIDSEDTVTLKHLMDAGYTPDSSTELWSLLDHPPSALAVIKFSPKTSEPLMMQLNVSNIKHYDLIATFMAHHGWQPGHDLSAAFTAWKRQSFPWLYGAHGAVSKKTN